MDSELSEPCSIPETIFRRIKLLQAYKSHYISMLDFYNNITLNKPQVDSLMDELQFVLSLADDSVIDYFVPPLLKILEEILLSKKDYSLAYIWNVKTSLKIDTVEVLSKKNSLGPIFPRLFSFLS